MNLNKPAVRRFFAMMREREALRVRKESGTPWPWTDDPILRSYKFTNVKRTDDRTTRLLLRDFYDVGGRRSIYYSGNERDQRRVVLLNCAIARYFGTHEFMTAVGWQDRFDPTLLKRTARQRLDAGERVYTGAYMISPCNRTGPKEAVIVDIFLKDLWRQAGSVVDWLERGEGRWKDVHTRLTEVEGFGGTGFMAKEVLLDTRLVHRFWPHGAPTDRYTWTPIGPGSSRGAGRMLGDDGGRAVSPAVTLDVCRQLFAMRKDHLPTDYSKGNRFYDMELHDIQFQLCEFSKYEKVRLGQGRPRSIYRRPE